MTHYLNIFNLYVFLKAPAGFPRGRTILAKRRALVHELSSGASAAPRDESRGAPSTCTGAGSRTGS